MQGEVGTSKILFQANIIILPYDQKPIFNHVGMVVHKFKHVY